MTSSELSVGVNLGVLSKRVTIDVSRKPLIGLLWLGTILMLLGGSLAALSFYHESTKIRKHENHF